MVWPSGYGYSRSHTCCFPKLERSIILYELPPDYKRVASRRTLNFIENENIVQYYSYLPVASNKRMRIYYSIFKFISFLSDSKNFKYVLLFLIKKT